MAPDAAATGGEQGEPPAAAAKTKAGPRLGGRGDGRGHAMQSHRWQMCESSSPQAGEGLSSGNRHGFQSTIVGIKRSRLCGGYPGRSG